MRAREVIARLDADQHEESGRVIAHRPSFDTDDAVFVKFPGRGSMWVPLDGRRVSGWTDHGGYTWRSFCLINRLRIRAALRRWAARHEDRTT